MMSDATDAYWDDLIAGIEETPDFDETPPAIDNEGDVDRLLRLRSRAARECERIHGRFDDEIDRLTRIRDDLLAGEQKTIAWVDQSLTGFGHTMRAGGKKSLTLPHGKITTRTSTKVEIDDEDALLAWLQANRPDLVRVKVEVAKAELRKAATGGDDEVPVDDPTVCLRREPNGRVLTGAGEILAGVRIVEGAVSVSIT